MGADIQSIGTWVAFILTLMIYCYLGKEIPFLHGIYRAAAYIFIGVALGYGAIMAWHGVFLPRLLLRLGGGQWWYLVPLGLCLLLLSRVKRSWAGLGNLTVAFVLGVGAALAMGGGILGTLIPQTNATFLSLNPGSYRGIAAREGGLSLTYCLNGLLVVIGTLSTVLYFYFTTGTVTGGAGPSEGSRFAAFATRARDRILYLSRGFGRVFIMFTFGALFATVAISYISVLVDRVRFILEFLWSQVPAP